MQISSTAIGAIISLLILTFFSFYREIGCKEYANINFTTGDKFDCIGFGFFPFVAVWKVFEQETTAGKGIHLFKPIPQIPLISSEGCFSVSRIEMIFSVLCFISVVIWLVVRKNDLPESGELMLTVICIWGSIRALTETLRYTPFLYIGNVNLSQILLIISADIILAIWTVRIAESEKSTAFAVLEWIACLSCQGILLMNSAGILTSGSKIGDMAVNSGCALLSMFLILTAGKKSRN